MMVEYMRANPSFKEYDVVKHFKTLGVSEKKTLWILREIA